MHGNAGTVETFDHPNYSMADADMEDEYAQSPPTAEGVLPDAAINYDAGHGAPMHTDAPPPSRKSNLRPAIRAQGVKKRLRSDDAEEASKEAKRAVKPMFSDPREIAALAQQPPAAPQPPPAAPQPPPAAPQPPPAAPQQQPVLSGNSGLSASTSLAPASTAANSRCAGNSAAAVATAAAATAAGLAHGPPTVELQTVGSVRAGQAQGPGQKQNSAGKQLGSALIGATFGVQSAGVQSAWKPSF